jgi:hypothetical protein
MKKSYIVLITIVLFVVFFLVIYTRRKEHFENSDDNIPLLAIKKMKKKFTLLSNELHKQKIREKDDLIQTIQDDLSEMDHLYRKKLINERQVTYETIQTQILKYISVFNKIVIDYKLNLLDIKIKDILEKQSYSRPNTSVNVYVSTDDYEGEA